MTHRVSIYPKNISFEVREGETILEAALRQKLQPPYSCRQATCGVCRAQLRKGAVFYAEDIQLLALHEDEIDEGFCLPCNAEINDDVELDWDNVYAPGEIRPRRVSAIVQQIEALNADTFRVRLELGKYDAVQFHAGQYLQLIMPDGNKRPFSIASSPEVLPQLEIHVRAVAGHDNALEVIEHFRAREVVSLEMPFGRAHLREDDRLLLFIAGGTGIATMKSIIESLQAHDDARERHLYWGVHGPEALYADELFRQIARINPRFHYHAILHSDNAELPHRRAAQDLDLSKMTVYCSGSMEMCKSVYADYLSRGVLAENFRSDLIDILRDAGQLNA